MPTGHDHDQGAQALELEQLVQLEQLDPEHEAKRAAHDRAVNFCAYPANDVALAVIVLHDGTTVTYDEHRPGRPATVSWTSADGSQLAYDAGPRRPA